MSEKIKALMDIIIEAYNNTEHCVKNPYYYSLNTCYNSISIDAGVDENMEKYIKEHLSPEVYSQYDWHKSVGGGGRMYITVR